jgi:hypothetical protein
MVPLFAGWNRRATAPFGVWQIGARSWHRPRKRPSTRQPSQDGVDANANDENRPRTSPETLHLMKTVEHPGEFSAEDQEPLIHPLPAAPRKRQS